MGRSRVSKHTNWKIITWSTELRPIRHL